MLLAFPSMTLTFLVLSHSEVSAAELPVQYEIVLFLYLY